MCVRVRVRVCVHVRVRVRNPRECPTGAQPQPKEQKKGEKNSPLFFSPPPPPALSLPSFRAPKNNAPPSPRI